MVFDESIVYVGSFNLNPRSAFINAEVALLGRSPELATRIAGDIQLTMRPENSWRVRIAESGALS